MNSTILLLHLNICYVSRHRDCVHTCYLCGLFVRCDVKMDVNYTSTNMSRKAHFSVGNTNLIGMIRARKFAIKIKKRAQFLVAHKRCRENTGRAILVHHDIPGLNTTPSGDGVVERMIISSSGEKLQTPHEVHEHKTVPDNIFPTLSVEEHMRSLLRVRMDGVKYDALICKELSKSLAEEIKQDVKTYHNLSRYKLICVVNIGETQHQCDVRFGSRCLWNEKFDNFASSFYRNSHIFVVATIFGVYFE